MQWKVYINRPRDLDELKENIFQEFCILTPDNLRRIVDTIVQRMLLCLNNNGAWISEGYYIQIKAPKLSFACI